MSASPRLSQHYLNIFLLLLGLLFAESLGSAWSERSATSVTAISGKSATFICAISKSSRESNIIWQDRFTGNVLAVNGRLTIDDSRYEIESHISEKEKFIIKDVAEGDAGLYRCLVPGDNTEFKNTFKLTVHVPPEIDRGTSTQSLSVYVKDTLTLKCNVTRGIPPANISWHKEELADPPESNTTEIVLPFTTPKIRPPKLREYDNINYRCEARNGVEPNAVWVINVKAEYKPQVTLLESSAQRPQKLGEPAVLECIIRMYPRTTMYWEKDGQILPDNHGIYSYTYRKEGHQKSLMRLDILSVEADDYGVYKCFATNSHGQASKKVSLVPDKRELETEATNRAPGPSTSPTQPAQRASVRTSQSGANPETAAATQNEKSGSTKHKMIKNVNNDAGVVSPSLYKGYAALLTLSLSLVLFIADVV